MANRVSWFWGPFWAAKTAQLPSVDLYRLFKQEIPYAIEEIIFVTAAFVATVAVAWVMDFALLIAFFSALIVWGVVFCQDTPNVYFSVRHTLPRPPSSVVLQSTERNVAILKLCTSLKTKYRYPFWTSSPHFSTFYNGLIRKALPMEFDRYALYLSLTYAKWSQRFIVPVADGGILAVDYTAPPKCPAEYVYH